jgi:hypothetical protein
VSFKNAQQERALITRRDAKRPYGAKVTFQILHSASIGDLENVSVLLDSGAIAMIQPARSNSWEGGKKCQIILDGFPTATAAETEGLRLAQAMLLLAISLNFGLRLVYHARVPAIVYERFRPDGISVWGEGVAGWPASIVLEELVAAYSSNVLDRTLILSMELYCAALLEMNERARFVTVVSALEPLAQQESLGGCVSAFVDTTLTNLEAAVNIDPNLRVSLRCRVAQLRRESVRQALFRLSVSWFPSRADVRQQIDRAYALRSELLHNGTLADPDTDLASETNKIVNVLRSIYERVSGRSFRAPTGV